MRLSEATIRRMQVQFGLHNCSYERLRDFARAVEAEVAELLCRFAEDGSFLHDDVPAARMAREFTKAVRAAYKEPTNG